MFSFTFRFAHPKTNLMNSKHTLFLFLILLSFSLKAQFSPQVSGTTQALWGSYSFNANNDTIFLVGAGGTILNTTNGGTTWNLVPVPATVTQLLHGIDFTSPTKGYIAATGGVLLRTYDRGATWSTMTSPTTVGLLCLNFIDDTTGFIGGGAAAGYGIWKTSDSGLTWYNKPSGGNFAIYDIQFSAGGNIGYACGIGGVIMKTIDRGTTWFINVPGATSGTVLTSLVVLNDTVVYVCGQSGTVKRTTNGGTSWVTLTTGITTYLNSICSMSDSIFIAAGLSGVAIRTTDAGATWLPLTSGVTSTFEKIFTGANARVFMVGTNGTIVKSTAPLPVRFLTFTGERKDQQNILSWITASENNCSFFTVERSADGHDWKKAGTVKAKGFSADLTGYGFADKDQPDGPVFYRIACYDTDGFITYSNDLQIGGENAGNRSLKVFPNPFTDKIVIVMEDGMREPVSFRLTDISGKTCYRKNAECLPDNGMFEINIADLKKGMYFLEVNAEGKTSMQKILCE